MILKQKNFSIIIRQNIMRFLIWCVESAALEMKYGFYGIPLKKNFAETFARYPPS